MTIRAALRKTGWQSQNDRWQSGESLYRALNYLSFKARNANAVIACETIIRILSEQR